MILEIYAVGYVISALVLTKKYNSLSQYSNKQLDQNDLYKKLKEDNSKDPVATTVSIVINSFLWPIFLSLFLVTCINSFFKK